MVGQEDIDLNQFLTRRVIKVVRKKRGRFSILFIIFCWYLTGFISMIWDFDSYPLIPVQLANMILDCG